MDRTDLLGNAGSCYVIEHNGKKYKMSRMIGRVKAQWELYLRSQHVAMLKELRDVLPPDLYQEEAKAYGDKLKAGYFRAEGEHSKEKLESPEGRLEILRICFSEYHPEMGAEELTDLLLHKSDEVEIGFMALMGPAIEAAKKKGLLREGTTTS